MGDFVLGEVDDFGEIVDLGEIVVDIGGDIAEVDVDIIVIGGGEDICGEVIGRSGVGGCLDSVDAIRLRWCRWTGCSLSESSAFRLSFADMLSTGIV